MALQGILVALAASLALMGADASTCINTVTVTVTAGQATTEAPVATTEAPVVTTPTPTTTAAPTTTPVVVTTTSDGTHSGPVPTWRTDACAPKALIAADQYARAEFATRTLPGIPKIDRVTPSNNPANVQRVMRILPEEKWDFIFPRRNTTAYTYLGFLQAVAKFPAWCDDAPDPTKKEEACRQEMAATFAHFVQETGEHNPKVPDIPEWRQGLYWVREIGASLPYRTNCDDPYWNKFYPCGAGQLYYGRGAKQLSYPYNYGPFSDVIYGDVTVLLNDPDMVANDPFLTLASAFWFGLTPQSPKPSMHDVITGYYKPGAAELAANIVPGFGATIHVINGGIECGQSGTTEIPQVLNRIEAYRNMVDYFGGTIDEATLGCRFMRSFPTTGVAALPLYWEKDWSWQACGCQQVSYQTPFSMLSYNMGYDACTCHYFQAGCK